MSLEIQFLGAAQTVTGAKYILQTGRAAVLLDCGFFQGRRQESNERNRNLGFDPASIDAVVLSHAHMDHSGALPLLVKNGYSGAIYTTPATRDLCAAMLLDAAFLQKADARYINKVIERDGADMRPVEPLYDETDVASVMQQMVSLPYHRSIGIAPGVQLSFYDAAHVLGSAVVAIDVEHHGGTKRIIYSGDLGRAGLPILRDPEVPSGGDFLILESTYGDRLHPPMQLMQTKLKETIARVYARGGKVLIPAFALERAQEVLCALHSIYEAGDLPPIPIYIDSPLTVKITDVFMLHTESFNADMRRRFQSGHSPFDFPNLVYVADQTESQAIDASSDPAIIISASGMCEGGRIVHHLKAAIGSERNAIVIVGFQAQHTLGRRIVERRPQVRIFGMEHNLRAEVVVLQGLSAHADQNELVEFAQSIRAQGNLQGVALVHGEISAQTALRKRLEAANIGPVFIPQMCEIIGVQR